MRLAPIAALAGLALILAGCFTSSEPLIPADTADFPFERLVYAAEGGEQSTLVRDGDAYVAPDDDSVRFRLRDYGDGYYLLQVSGTDEAGSEQALYGVAVLDRAAMAASLYRLVARPDDLGDGEVPECTGEGREGFGCLTDGQQLVDVVRAAIAAGEAPDGVIDIVAME